MDGSDSNVLMYGLALTELSKTCRPRMTFSGIQFPVATSPNMVAGHGRALFVLVVLAKLDHSQVDRDPPALP